MPRAAGSGTHYEFVLREAGTGNLLEDHTIRLPSVTTIIKAVLAAPALINWAYRQTVESVEILHDHKALDLEVDDLDALLEHAKLRPNAVRDSRGEEGSATHRYLERLVATGGRARPSDEREIALQRWYVSHGPRRASNVEGSEVIVWSLAHEFSGTVDLIWWDHEGQLTITDLKTRNSNAREGYVSDLAQVAAYKIAYEELTGM